MDFPNDIKLLAEKIQSFKPNTKTEEATKTAFIIPFLRLLGYDDTNPTEVIPEFTADFGDSKANKVDYAIYKDGSPIMVIECKYWKDNLEIHDPQLCKYFNATQAKFGILTNGIRYKFFTDIDEINKMDKEPFLEFDFENIKEATINELLKFHKSSFDVDKVLNSASDLKNLAKLRIVLEKELSDPSEEFVKFLGKQVCEKNFTKKQIESFTPLVKKTTNLTIKELVNERLQAALKKEEEVVVAADEDISENESPLIVTTEEELEGFVIVKSILRSLTDVAKIQYKDNQNYFAIYFEKQNKPICRLHFNRAQKYLGVIKIDKSNNKEEERIPIDNLDDIFKYSDRLMDHNKFPVE